MKLPEHAWNMKIEEVSSMLESSSEGLNEKEAKNRLKIFGKNELKKKRVDTLKIFFSQFASPLVFVLFIAAILSYFLEEEKTSAVVIAVLIGINGALGFLQEYKSQKAAEKLGKLISFTAKVMRGGKIIEISVNELVPGDVVLIQNGDKVPADLRIMQANDLLAEEAVLTGESYPVKKTTEQIIKADAPQDMRNMAFMGTLVSNGTGIGMVVATSEKTFFGQTAALLEETEEKSSFEKNIAEFSSIIVKIIAISLFFVFVVNAVLGKGIFQSILFALALAVGIVPEALPVIITLSLSAGSLALSKHGVIVKRLSAIEDLGNVDILCTDKTGTLTESAIKVQDYYNADGKKDEKIIQYAGMCTSIVNYKGKISGNPIDIAIADYAKTPKYELVHHIPFDYERRRMSSVVKIGGKLLFICKGSPESVIAISKTMDKKKLIEDYHSLGEQGFRAIAVGFKTIEKRKNYTKEDECALEFLGFISFMDPPKKTVKQSLDIAKKLGITIKLITGDNAVVAKNIAKQVGFEFTDDNVITGEELEKISKNVKKLIEATEKCTIFARVSPVQKYLIIKTLRANGHVVAFLGDGVNDAPALKEADVGISVNNGADVTKETADIILLKKSINSVVQGISGGRKVFSNIIKYITTTMAGNFGDLYTIAFISPFLKFMPLKPVQILLANLVSDAPMISIATDNVDDEELLKPKKWNVREIAKFGALLGLVSMIFDLLLIMFIINETAEVFQTALYVEIILSEIVIITCLRSSRAFFKAEMPSPMLLITTIISLVVGIGIIYSPFGSLFGFVQLPLNMLIIIGGVVFGYFVCTEIVKLIYVRTFKNLAYDEKALAVLRKKIAPDLH